MVNVNQHFTVIVCYSLWKYAILCISCLWCW